MGFKFSPFRTTFPSCATLAFYVPPPNPFDSDSGRARPQSKKSLSAALVSEQRAAASIKLSGIQQVSPFPLKRIADLRPASTSSLLSSMPDGEERDKIKTLLKYS